MSKIPSTSPPWSAVTNLGIKRHLFKIISVERGTPKHLKYSFKLLTEVRDF